MTQTAINYAKVLYERSVPPESVEDMQEILSLSPPLCRVLKSPVATRREKHRVIDRIFHPDMRTFLKVVCDNGDADLLKEIGLAYEKIRCQAEGVKQVTLFYVTKPSREQLSQLAEMVKKRCHAADVQFSLKEDKSLMGGFILRFDGRETDWSLKGRLGQLERRLTK